jgi:competence protein ComEC
MLLVLGACGGEKEAPKSSNAITTPVDKSDAVFVTESGKKYHRAGCRYLDQSSRQMSKNDAIKAGYGPCDICKPY